MADLAALFAAVFRDYQVDGVPSEPPYEPKKSEIRALGPAIASEILARYSAPVAGVQSRTVATPPASPSAGQKWIVPPGGTGVFAGQAGKVAEYSGSSYVFTAPTPGYTAFVLDEVELYGYDGAAWNLLTGAAIAKALLSELAAITTAPADKEAHVYADVIGTTVSRARSSNVATVVYAAAHGLSVGNTYNQRGLSGSGYNGRVTVASVPNAATVTYASTGGNESTTADAGGSADRNGVYRSDGAGAWPWISDLNVDIVVAQLLALKAKLAPTYSSVAAGLADVASGNYFAVRPSAYPQMAEDVYLASSGAAAYQYSRPAGGVGKLLDTSYPSAGGPYGGFYWAVVDASNRIGLGVDQTGRLVGKFVAPGAGLVASYDVHGRETLAFDPSGLGSLPLGGETLDASQSGVFGGYAFALVDSAARLAFGVKADGTTAVQKLQIGSVSIGSDIALATHGLADSANAFAHVAWVGAYANVYSTSKSTGVSTRVSQAGNNTFPQFSTDGSKLLYWTDRNGSVELFYAPAGGGAEHRVFPLTSLYCLGDSLTAGAGGTPYPTQLSTLLGGRLTYNDGLGGQGSKNTSQRFGAVAVTVTVSGNQIPASGGVAVTLSDDFLNSAGNPAYSVLATIGGVHGALARASGSTASYTFTRDTGGSIVAVSPGSSVTVDVLGHDEWTALFEMGRNDGVDSGGYSSAATLANIAACVARIKAFVPRYLVLAILNGTGEGTGTTVHTNIIGVNAQLASLYGASFVDVRSPPSSAEMTALSYTPTSQDLTDIANDCIPTGMRASGDPLHLNTIGYALWAMRVQAALIAKGW